MAERETRGASYLKQLIDATDPYATPRDIIGGFQYRPQKAGDETTAIGVGLGQAILSGILKGKSRQHSRDQVRGLASIMRGLREDPENVLRPEGLEDDIFGAYQTQAIQDKLDREIAQRAEERELKDKMQLKLFDVIGAGIQNNPLLAKKFLQDPNALLDSLSGEEGTSTPGLFEEREASPAFDLLEEEEERPRAEKKAEPEEDLGIRSSEERARSLYYKTLDETGDVKQAQSAADSIRDQAKSTKTQELKKISEERDRLNKVDTTLYGVDEALEELPFQGVPGQGAITSVARLLSQFDKDGGSYDKFLGNAKAVDRLQAFATSLFRTPGEGVITEAEREGFLSALPTRGQSKAENKASVGLLRKGVELFKEYNDLKEDHLTKFGDLEGFQQRWDKKKAQMMQGVAFEGGLEPTKPSIEDFLKYDTPEEALAAAKAAGLIDG